MSYEVFRFEEVKLNDRFKGSFTEFVCVGFQQIYDPLLINFGVKNFLNYPVLKPRQVGKVEILSKERDWFGEYTIIFSQEKNGSKNYFYNKPYLDNSKNDIGGGFINHETHVSGQHSPFVRFDRFSVLDDVVLIAEDNTTFYGPFTKKELNLELKKEKEDLNRRIALTKENNNLYNAVEFLIENGVKKLGEFTVSQEKWNNEITVVFHLSGERVFAVGPYEWGSTSRIPGMNQKLKTEILRLISNKKRSIKRFKMTPDKALQKYFNS